ncbi:MAG: Uma2 family endonuclease [Synechococcaceae cyanobacterium SM2_3_1]|nr:Uma2 family endonuclease [Synechococcaceae cyanobacterium SM2_3_1]
MTAAQRLTFEQYLEQDHATDQRYELVDGRLTELPPESEPNSSLANFLFLQLVNAGLSFRQIHLHACEIQVPVLQPGDPANRYPELTILRPEHLELTRKRLTITFDALPPDLVVEIVSPGERSRDRDYNRKRAQYAARGIPEYWLVDPDINTILVLQRDGGSYQEVGQFTKDIPIQSPQLEQLGIIFSLTATQIFRSVQ